MKYILPKFILLLVCFTHLSAQNTNMMKNQYEGIYILFGSECCGIDKHAFDDLQKFIRKFESENPKKLQQKSFAWGKEGERVLCLTDSSLFDDAFHTFAEKILSNFQNKNYKLVTARTLLFMEAERNILWLHLPPFGILQAQEKKCLEYLNTLESELNHQIVKGAMINETHLETDQDKRYELDVKMLSQDQKIQLIKKLKEIILN